MARHTHTTTPIIEEAYKILAAEHPMTLRQVYYRLVSSQVVENTLHSYKAVGRALCKARREGDIPWAWIEDRTRRPHHYVAHSDLQAFMNNTVRYGYRCDVWRDQPGYLEVWCEKDALYSMFTDAMWNYGVWLTVGRGYPSLTAVHDAAQRYRTYLQQGKHSTILYFGDFDPSGEDIVRAVEDGLNEQGAFPTVIKVALTQDDIVAYNLPPNPTKSTDSRSAAFVAKHGAVSSVELDALPPAILRERIQQEVKAHMDIAALGATKLKESQDNLRLRSLVELTRNDKLLERLMRLAPWIERMSGDDLFKLYNESYDVRDIMSDISERDADYRDDRPDYVGDDYDPTDWERETWEDEDDELDDE